MVSAVFERPENVLEMINPTLHVGYGQWTNWILVNSVVLRRQIMIMGE